MIGTKFKLATTPLTNFRAMDARTVGILGGGQLGRMLVEAANRLNIKTVILDAPQSPAKQISAANDHVDGSFSDPEAIATLAKKCDILTAEIEHIDTNILETLQNQQSVVVHPSPLTIRTIQDKYLQKQHFSQNSIPTPESYPVDSDSANSISAIAKKVGYPMMLKSRTLAYDGRGNFVIKSAAEVDAALAALSGRPLYVERWASFTKELAVMVVRSSKGLIRSYPTVETIHQDNICHLVFAPARVPFSTRKKARALAEEAVKTFEGAGVFGVEMFWFSETDSLMINEIAPRPHNSGHYTIEACPISQYEAHIRAILDLPLPENCTELASPAIMLNILGTESSSSYLETCQRALGITGAHVHLYGKEEARKGRKMGHITFTASSMALCEELLEQCMAEEGSKVSHAEVAVIMGSDSDLPVMAAGCQVLEDFGVKPLVTIVSAHRTPERMVRFAKSASYRGIKVIIAGAGGAAHLPGMVAAMTPLPVIGVPVKATHLDGLDSLLSIVQMPRGIPAATVAINNSTNAALLALRILGGSRPEICDAMEEYLASLKQEVGQKIEKLEDIGWRQYLAKR